MIVTVLHGGFALAAARFDVRGRWGVTCARFVPEAAGEMSQPVVDAMLAALRALDADVAVWFPVRCGPGEWLAQSPVPVAVSRAGEGCVAALRDSLPCLGVALWLQLEGWLAAARASRPLTWSSSAHWRR